MTRESSDESTTRAGETVSRVHAGQVDRAEEDVLHSAAARYLGGNDFEAFEVAFLHEVVDVSKMTESRLAADYSPEIIEALRALRRTPGEDYMSFIRRCAGSPLARRVWIANLRHILDPERLQLIEEAERKRLRATCGPALSYLLSFITDKDELSRQLSEECRHLPPGILPHSALNRAVFAHPEMIRSLLTNYVDAPFVEDLDLERIEPLPTGSVTEDMSRQYGDHVRKVRWRDQTAYLLIIIESGSTQDIRIPVRILAYTALLWLDLLDCRSVTREDGLPPVFPIVIRTRSEKWDEPMTIHELFSSVPESVRKYQPDNRALLVDETTITDEVLHRNTDFYAMYLLMKRARTPMEMRDVIGKYLDAFDEHDGLARTFLAVGETIFRQYTRSSSFDFSRK